MRCREVEMSQHACSESSLNVTAIHSQHPGVLSAGAQDSRVAGCQASRHQLQHTLLRLDVQDNSECKQTEGHMALCTDAVDSC